MSITRRIALVSASAVAVTVVIISVVVYLGARSRVLGPIDDSLAVRVERYDQAPSLPTQGVVRLNPDGTLRRIDTAIPRTWLELFRPRSSAEFDDAYVQLIGRTGVVNVGEGDLVLPHPQAAAVGSGEVTFRSVWVDGVHLRIAAVHSDATNTIIQVGRPLTEADETLERFAFMLVLTGAFGVVLAAGLGLVVARTAVRPLTDLEASIAGVAGDRTLGTRLEVKGSDEVAHLAQAFNDLLDELETARHQQARLVRDAGHELRTPLTALRTNLEVLQRHRVGEADRERMLDAAHAEVEELSALVTEIVDLATDRYQTEPLSVVAIADVVDEVTGRFVRRSGRRIVVDTDDSAVRGRRAALERAVGNIVANADKWSPPDGTITIDVAAGTVTVRDEGQGFNAEDLDHVFERFYRSTAARATHGSGLGLSIVEQIVTDHGGTVFARNRSDGQGAEVGFTVPVVDR
ncbi:MAG: HAMP domain-containing sensor histidine kinase [Acidimicrobiia bacterium]